MTGVLLEVKDLTKRFPIYGGVFYRQVATVHAMEAVSLSLKHGETLGLVGESGCGKSTLGRAIMQLYRPDSGSVSFNGKDLGSLSAAALRATRRELQMIFQDPYESLNQRHSVAEILEEPFIIHRLLSGPERRQRVRELLSRVGLPQSALQRYPHEFSGGQRQRLGIARAIALGPQLVVCDEAVSALDVSIQSQILNLLLELQAELGLAYLFIAHNLAVVKHMSDNVAVMYLGRIVELAPAVELYQRPQHPYTHFLLQAIPTADTGRVKTRQLLTGDLPSPVTPPPGCKFHTRCPFAEAACRQAEPPLQELSPGHWVRCIHPGIAGR